MHVFRFPLACCLLTILVSAITSVAARAEPVKLWHGNRITPEQPFPARVIGVVPSWVGYTLLLEEITEKEPRYCIAKLWAAHGLKYTVVMDKKAFRDVHDSQKATHLDPGVAVNDFSWSIGAFTIGRRFGDQDFVARQYPVWNKRDDGRGSEPE